MEMRFDADEMRLAMILQEMKNEYIRLKNCRVEYLLTNGMIIDFMYKEENFVHLSGLHKLEDIQLI